MSSVKSGNRESNHMKHESNMSHHISMDLGDVAYIKLPSFGDGAKVSRTVSLREVMKDYNGRTDVELDFSADGTLMGIEVLAL